MPKKLFFVLLCLIITETSTSLFAQPGNIATLTVDRLTISFNPETRTFEWFDSEEGILLSSGIITAKVGGEIISTNDHKIKPIIKQIDRNNISLHFHENLMVFVKLLGDNTVIFSSSGTASDSVTFSANAPLSERTLGCRLNNEQDSDQNTLVQVLGNSHLKKLKSVFDPLKDLALQISSDGTAEWERKYQWRIEAKAVVGQNLCRIQLFRHYYRDTLGITYYAPVKKRSYFQKAPALAMTWVGIEGKYNRPDFSQRKEWLFPNIDWVSENLLPYAEEMVFQLDDNYPIDDPQYMRDISDYIRSKKLIPGIWIAPFGVAPYDETKRHPDWFIHNADGSIITTFSGLSYDDVRHYSSAVLNVNSDEGVDTWFAGFLKQVDQVWNYDYYKVDGIPAVLNVYKKSVDGGGVDGVRRGLQILRDVVGEDKYMNSCWGLPLEVLDIVNGSRVGGDTEQVNQVVSQVAVKQNYLNNIAWYSDPDGAANMYASTPARARLNFQSRALLGQPYVTDDTWTKVPDDILFVWQRTLPTIESFPTNLYQITETDRYDHFDLKIQKSWGEWDVAGLNNYENISRRMILDLNRLPLSSEAVYVYDFWNRKYLGIHTSGDQIVRDMNPIDAQCFRITPVDSDLPVLISTNRHFTQGGIDVSDIKIEKADEEWHVMGWSEHLVKDDPYELVFIKNGYRITHALITPGEEVHVYDIGELTSVTFLPKTKDAKWMLRFVPDSSAAITFSTEALHVCPGEKTTVPIRARNGANINWHIRSSDNKIQIEEDHINSLVSILVARDAVGPDQRLSAKLTIVPDDPEVATNSLDIEVLGDIRMNLAPNAKASASSVYFQGDQNGYGRPEGVNDGRSFRAWEAAEGETSAWVKLTWDEKVSFSRIVIDEWMESGGKIESWVLVADDKRVLKRGTEIGRGLIIDFKKEIKAQSIKLIILQSSDRPGIWEMEVK